MLAYKLFGSGLTTLSVEAMKDVATALTATGTSQATAYEVTFSKNAFSTVAAGTGAVLDSDAAPGGFASDLQRRRERLDRVSA